MFIPYGVRIISHLNNEVQRYEKGKFDEENKQWNPNSGRNFNSSQSRYRANDCTSKNILDEVFEQYSHELMDPNKAKATAKKIDKVYEEEPLQH